MQSYLSIAAQSRRQNTSTLLKNEDRNKRTADKHITKDQMNLSAVRLHCRPDQPKQEIGGARRDRTDDLLLAKQALSQLSYGPEARPNTPLPQTRTLHRRHGNPLKLVGLGRFELPTSPLSGVRSNQLSYRPGIPTEATLRLQRRTPGLHSKTGNLLWVLATGHSEKPSLSSVFWVARERR